MHSLDLKHFSWQRTKCAKSRDYCNYFFTLCTIYLAVVEMCLCHNVYLAKSSSSCRAFLMSTDLYESMDRTSWKLKGTKVWSLTQNLPLQTSFNHELWWCYSQETRRTWGPKAVNWRLWRVISFSELNQNEEGPVQWMVFDFLFREAMLE